MHLNRSPRRRIVSFFSLTFFTAVSIGSAGWLTIGTAALPAAAADAAAGDFDPSTWSPRQVIRLRVQGDAVEDFAGRVLAVDQATGGLFQRDDGGLRVITWDQVRGLDATEEVFEPASVSEVADAIRLAQPGVSTLTSDHYVVLYRGGPAYAEWIVGMYERLYRGFYDFWKSHGLNLEPPEFPLVVNVFVDNRGYLQQAERDKLDGAESMIGYYHLHTNQTVSFDLSGAQLAVGPNQRLNKNALIRMILSRPQAERNVATIVHEAVHQLSYNSGLQVRLADNPLWLSEGIALFFESPDLSSSRGWSGIGKVNRYQLAIFKRLPEAATSDWITALIQDDQMFTTAATVNAAYARSWALTYFLLKTRPEEFAAYMRQIGDEPPLAPLDTQRRLEMFHEHFGEDTTSLQRELVRRISRL